MAQDGPTFARTHVAHAFNCMIGAATLWVANPPESESIWRLNWTAEYAAFAHQRALYELFCDDETGARRGRELLGLDDSLGSDPWRIWRQHLNTAALHLHGRWSERDPVVDDEHLKNQVAMFACDIVGLWSDLESLTPADVSAVLKRTRLAVIGQARRAADDLGLPPLDWSAPEPFAAWEGGPKWWPRS